MTPKSLFNLGDDTPAAQGRKTRRAHLVGIAGSGMRSLAEVLRATGWTISGSDLNWQSLGDAPFQVHGEHRAEQIDGQLDALIHSAAVPRGNSELRRARQLGVPILSYSQVLGQLMGSRNSVAVAGTHGKSTTTAMAGEILSAAGMDPTVIFGAEPLELKSASRYGRGHWMVVEACEYQGNFRHLQPQIALLLGIEPDHFDCFPAPADLEAAFAEFLQQVPREGLVLARAECAITTRLTANLPCARESVGFASTATWRAAGLRERRGLYSFQVRCRERLVCDVKLNVPGHHNVLNALAAAALASHCGVTGRAIRSGLEHFAGLRRRLETICDGPELTVIDDYAHHPTAVAAALATVRQTQPDRRVWCVFQPHQVSRTTRLLDEFAHSLQNADKIVVAEIYRAREEAVAPGEITAADLATRVAALGKETIQLPTAADIRRHLHHSLQPGDVVVTMGAGDIGTISHELAKNLRTFRQAG